MAVIEEGALSMLEGFSGELLRPGEPGYEEARRIHNGLIDKRPALIARCRGVADVAAAVNLAREESLEVSIRGGGHNVAGRSVTEGGLMIDLSPMRGIYVDPARRTARAQGGVNWGELNRETQLHGLAVTGGVVSTTGIAGLTLGGGIGWLMPKYGLTVDNLLSAEIVTADGRVLQASGEEHADLFWGLRGGGGNFGVVTSFEYQLHQVGPLVTGGFVIHPFTAAVDLFRFFRDFLVELPEHMMVVPGLLHAPDGSGAKLAALIVCHVGSLEEAERDLEPLRRFGSPLEVQVGPISYNVMNSLLDAGSPKGALNYWKSSFLRGLSDAAIETLVNQFAACPSPMTAVVIEHFRGAVTRIPSGATAVWHRQPGFNLAINGAWLDPSTTDENVAWARGAIAAMGPYLAEQQYVNYVADDEGADHLRAAFGPNYERLVQVKRAYDPDNLFRLNHNIPPGSSGGVQRAG